MSAMALMGSSGFVGGCLTPARAAAKWRRIGHSPWRLAAVSDAYDYRITLIDRLYYRDMLTSLDISFDPAKRAATLKERRLDFVNASLVFEGEVATRPDDRFDYGEDRFITAGYLNGRMVVVVWTPRGNARHIISMRHAHAKEERSWLSDQH
jgi:uncharacterized DUF497 family protein